VVATMETALAGDCGERGGESGRSSGSLREVYGKAGATSSGYPERGGRASSRWRSSTIARCLSRIIAAVRARFRARSQAAS